MPAYDFPPSYQPVAIDWPTRSGGGYTVASDHYGQDGDAPPYQPADHPGIPLTSPSAAAMFNN